MQKSTKEIGKRGENLALQYMADKGYDFITQNYHFRKSEIDLIFVKDLLLIFVEVKYRSSQDFGLPEEMVSEKQKDLILEAAENYILENNWKYDIRFDIISILAVKDQVEISHFEDAFY